MKLEKSQKIVMWFTLCLMITSITVLVAFQHEIGLDRDAKMVLVEELREAGINLHELLNPEAELYEEPIQLPFGGFIANRGQITYDNSYYFDQNDVGLYFKESEILFSNKEDETFFTVQFPGAAAVQPIGTKKTDQSVNYFLNDFQMTDVPTFDEIWYYDLYLGIDLRYYMSPKGLKYEFIVHPRGNPTQIAIQLSEPLLLVVAPERITSKTLPSQAIVFEDYNLRVFQADGTIVGAQFIQHRKIDRCYGIRIDTYDKTQDLIIDPLIAAYSTYLGGDSEGIDIAMDSTGNAYVTGETSSSNFPTQNPYQASKQDSTDLFVTKLNATGNGLVYSTYLGGQSSEHGNSIAVDSAGNAYVTGRTKSRNFPTLNAYQTTHQGGYFDAFVIKLNATGNGLIFSTYLGGDSDDYGNCIAVDPANNAYITGPTRSSNFPTLYHYQTYQTDGDAFVTKLNATGNGLVYSTFLGGSSEDHGSSIAVDPAGNAYITGPTRSSDFPTQNPYQTTRQGSDDVFVTKLNATGNGLVYSTYLGGNSYDNGRSIAVDSAGNTYVTGETSSNNFPTLNHYQTYQTELDVFVTKLNATGNGLVYSTYLGGNDSEYGANIAVDSRGNAYITGNTMSTNFPTQYQYQTDLTKSDTFVTKLNAMGNELVYSTYLGGDHDEECWGIAVDSAGNAYVTGSTSSNNFPAQHPFQATRQEGGTAFVTKLILFPTVNIDSPTATTYATNTLTVALSGDADHYWYYIAGEDNNNQSWTINVNRTLVDGTYTLHAFGNDSVGNEAQVSVSFIVDTSTTTTTPTTTISSTTGFTFTILCLSLLSFVIFIHKRSES